MTKPISDKELRGAIKSKVGWLSDEDRQHMAAELLAARRALRYVMKLTKLGAEMYGSTWARCHATARNALNPGRKNNNEGRKEK